MNDKLNNCLNEIANLPKEDKVSIRGKMYAMVNTRVKIFRKHFASESRIKTEMIHNDLEKVSMKATVFIKDNGEWVELGNGHAEEFRADSNVNKNSAVENCETSAIGRALASCGLSGDEYASSFEVENAMNQKPAAPDLSDGYIFRKETGMVLAHSNNPSDFLKTLRSFLGDPESKDAMTLFSVNEEVITRAEKDATKKSDKDAYAKLGKLFRSEQHEEELSAEA